MTAKEVIEELQNAPPDAEVCFHVPGIYDGGAPYEAYDCPVTSVIIAMGRKQVILGE